MIIQPEVDRRTNSDSRLKGIAKKYGIDVSLLTDVNNDGVINAEDAQLIASGQSVEASDYRLWLIINELSSLIEKHDFIPSEE